MKMNEKLFFSFKIYVHNKTHKSIAIKSNIKKITGCFELFYHFDLTKHYKYRRVIKS